MQWAALDVAQLKAPTRTAELSSNDATDDATRTAGWSSSDATDRFVRAPITTRGPGPRPVREQGAWQHVRARRASRQRPHARRSSSARADEKPSCRGQPRGSYRGHRTRAFSRTATGARSLRGRRGRGANGWSARHGRGHVGARAGAVRRNVPKTGFAGARMGKGRRGAQGEHAPCRRRAIVPAPEGEPETLVAFARALWRAPDAIRGAPQHEIRWWRGEGLPTLRARARAVGRSFLHR